MIDSIYVQYNSRIAGFSVISITVSITIRNRYCVERSNEIFLSIKLYGSIFNVSLGSGMKNFSNKLVESRSIQFQQTSGSYKYNGNIPWIRMISQGISGISKLHQNQGPVPALPRFLWSQKLTFINHR